MAFLGTTIIIFAVAFLSEFDGSKGDPCSSYRSLNDPHRSTKYRLSSGERAYCDIYLVRGWYRFTSIVGGKMPTTKPEPYHCGTVAPIWMKGPHPTTTGEIRDNIACTSLNGHACLFPYRMQVKHCGAYFVYRLSPTRGCSMAYCAGDLMPCRKGLVGIVPNCTVPDITPFPLDLVPTPNITYRVYNTRTVCLHCNFSFPLWKNVSFDIQWFKDGHPIKKHKNDSVCQEQKPFDDADPCSQRYSVLGPSRFRAGHRITCKLRTRYNTNHHNNWTASWTFSEGFYVGIKVEPSHFVTRVSECGEKTNFTFQPTIPILPDENSPLDHVPVNIYIPQSFVREGKQSAMDHCVLRMRGTEVSELQIQGICDNQDDTAPSVLEYHFQLFHVDVEIWGFYTLPSIRVTVENTPIRTCTSRNDPRYTTFDIKRFDLLKQVGDFVLYKNRNLKTEVHTRVWVCNTVWSATCNCGVAIRSGGDVIVATVCDSLLKYNNQLTYLRTQIRSTGPLARGTHIYKKQEGSYALINVHLPSGIRVEIQRHIWGMNIFIHSYQSKSSNTSGLCGNFNNNYSDDFYNEELGRNYADKDSFAESWRINASESYFKILPKEEEDPYTGRSCQCPYGNASIEEAYDCDDTAVLMQTFDNALGKEVPIISVRSKRETAYHDDIMEYEEKGFFEDDQAAHFAERRIRSKRAISEMSVMSQENATLLCKRVIEDSTAGKTCSKVEGINLKILMKECVADLQLTGDTRFVESAFESMKSECEEMALRNLSLYTRDASGKLEPPVEIGNKLCPNDCSNHGNCTNRTCICEEGYTAADCSMPANAIPELLGIYDGGLCDIRRRPCKKTDIFGQDFLDSENLTCHVQEFKVVESVWTPRSLSMKYSGSMEDLFIVRCNLSDPPTKLGDYDHEGTPAGGLLISISNDGEHKSQRQMRFISYDSVCMACNKTGNCTFKSNACLIRGHCFAANEPNPRDWCQQCLPGKSQSSWSARKVNHQPKFAANQSTRYAIHGEYLPLQLKATDPDNRPVEYSLLSSTATGYTFSSTGLLKWKASSRANQQFVFKVTDECNATDTITMTIHIVTCPCQNDGKCSPHPYYPRGSGQYFCTCPQGFTGDRCETNIDDCVGVNCGNGTCNDGINNYTCRCNPGFSGLKCNKTICTNQTCFPGVTCTEIPAGVSCGPCPVGFSGDGKTCVVIPTSEGPTTSSQKPTTEQVSSTAPSTAQSTTEQVTSTSPSTAQSTTEQVTSTSPSTAQSTTEQVPSTSASTAQLPEQDTTTTREPTSTSAATGSTKHRAEIRIKKKWNEDYRNKKSQAFRTLVQLLIQEIWKSFKEEKNKYLKNVEVISLRPGSVIAEFELIFEKEQKDPLAPLRASVQDGKMGSLEVDSSSLKIKSDKKDTGKKDNVTLIAVLVVVGVIVLVVAAAFAVIAYRRPKHKNYPVKKKQFLHRKMQSEKHGNFEMEESYGKERKENADPKIDAYDNAGLANP